MVSGMLSSYSRETKERVRVYTPMAYHVVEQIASIKSDCPIVAPVIGVLHSETRYNGYRLVRRFFMEQIVQIQH